MTAKPILSHSRTDFLSIALWWGLVAGFGEGRCRIYSHPWIWHDLMRGAVIVDPLLFAGLALLIIVLNRSLRMTRELLVRATLGFGFLALYGVCDALVPRVINLLPFLTSLVMASIFAVVFYFYHERAVRFQKKSLVFLIAAAAWCVVAFPLQQHRKEARELAQLKSPAAGARNALVIVVDTLRADHLSAYGYSRPTSPNLASIAEQGVRFDNAISPSSWTLPSHASMLTGLYPHDHHVDHDTSNLGRGYPTLGEALSAEGYRTAAFSGNAGTFGRDRGFGRGFIHFEDDFQTWGSTVGRSFYGGKIEARLCQLHLMRDLLGRPTAAEITERALRWIDSDRRPFFVFLNYYDAHDPYLPPDPYLHKYTNMRHPGGWYTQHWEWFENLTPAQRQAALDAYDGAINYVDAEVAHLMRELHKRGLSENTLVIITSDHGEGFQEHRLMNHGNSLYLELIHVPLIVFGRGHIPSGRTVSEPVSLTALPSTVLDLLNISGKSPFSVPSLAELWSERGSHSTPAPPLSELAQLKWSPNFPNYYAPMQSITTSQWHYITGGNTGQQLFRCCDDAPEAPDVAATAEGKKVCEGFRRELQLALKAGLEDKGRQTGLAAKAPHHAGSPSRCF